MCVLRDGSDLDFEWRAKRSWVKSQRCCVNRGSILAHWATKRKWDYYKLFSKINFYSFFTAKQADLFLP